MRLSGIGRYEGEHVMRDIRSYPDHELTRHVYNDEYFYQERQSKDYLIALCKEEFLFTPAQLGDLLSSLGLDCRLYQNGD